MKPAESLFRFLSRFFASIYGKIITQAGRAISAKKRIVSGVFIFFCFIKRYRLILANVVQWNSRFINSSTKAIMSKIIKNLIENLAIIKQESEVM